MTVIQGNCFEVMESIEPDVFHSIVTDPPYGIGQWDWIDDAKGKATPQAQQAWHTEWAKAGLRVVRPGGHALVFGGSRTFHRIGCALEDAGWELRDCLMWLYGSGWVKAADLGGDWTGWRSSLKPGWEPILVCRKPLARGDSVLRSMDANGTGAMNVEDCSNGKYPSNVLIDEEMESEDERLRRYFYCPKPSPAEREAGLLERLGQGSAIGGKREKLNNHPTVKPIELMRWLCRLVTPPNGRVLDPFTGSGTTGCAAVLEGFQFVGVELDEEHAELARQRIHHWSGEALRAMGLL